MSTRTDPNDPWMRDEPTSMSVLNGKTSTGESASLAIPPIAEAPLTS
jgi:hypothetical protein